MNQNQEKFSLSQFIAAHNERSCATELTGIPSAARSFALVQYCRQQRTPAVVVVPTPKQAEQLIEDITFFSRGMSMPIRYFPPYNIQPFKFLSYHNETAAQRIRTLYRQISTDGSGVTVTTVDALMQRVIPKRELTDFAELLMVGEDIDLDALIRKLISGGYNRSIIVEEPGDFTIRGGILDIFSPLYEEPLRVELFGDTVDALRFFSPATQRTTHRVEEAVILPAKEAVLKIQELDQLLNRIRTRAAELDMPVTQLREMVRRIKEEGIFPGMESLISMIYDETGTYFDYVPTAAVFFLFDPPALESAAIDAFEQASATFRNTVSEKRLCVPPHEMYLDWEQLNKRLQAAKPVSFKALALRKDSETVSGVLCQYQADVNDNSQVIGAIRPTSAEKRPLEPLIEWFRANKAAGYLTLFVCSTRAQADRMCGLLKPYDIHLDAIDHFPHIRRGKGVAYIGFGSVSEGFVWPDESLAVITDAEIFGSGRPRRKRDDSKIHTELLQLGELKQGDFVVHTDHGIGRYGGLEKLRLNGSVNDFLLILYKDDDKLYLPVERMSLIQKYMGVEGVIPVLDKMGGKSWEKVKTKVRRSTEKIAGELLKLYASRKVKKGHAFGMTDAYFKNFEAGFPYEETADQRKAIENVLEDMRIPVPMDRLVCGDVGYGKTEVALRAAFLAVSEAKQVAVLVPTTVLAEQHYTTFQERFRQYPVTIACLSRFRSLKVQREIIKGLANGTVDIVIGTHRLLSRDVAFKELGLLVLDEEQRFGVKHKEKLKRYRETVDVLTLTATPIPRTLHLSLLGVRDIDVISTPPEDRRPIITYVSEFDEGIAAEAIRKELRRNGQIFFVYNNIRSIDRMAGRLKKLVPEVRLDVAHGQMSENDLEKVMWRFMNKELDMLVCTTIIESGLDISTANTILVNRADRFGLAQIYQLRGRVGRSDEQAYAYLFIPPESTLTKDAVKRLKVLMEHSDLGSGFQIAMSDLKIRGGGTILGASQSGHIAAVGYDMFLKLMEDSIAELKGNPIQEGLEPEINLPMSSFLPEDYIPDIDQRLAVYRRLARMTGLKEITDLKAELTDRFGVLPDEAGNLLLKIMLKVLSIQAGVKKLDLAGQQVLLTFSEAHQQRPLGIMKMMAANQKKYRLTPDHLLKAQLEKAGGKAQLAEIKNILIQIAQHVNC